MLAHSRTHSLTHLHLLAHSLTYLLTHSLTCHVVECKLVVSPGKVDKQTKKTEKAQHDSTPARPSATRTPAEDPGASPPFARPEQVSELASKSVSVLGASPPWTRPVYTYMYMCACACMCMCITWRFSTLSEPCDRPVGLPSVLHVGTCMYICVFMYVYPERTLRLTCGPALRVDHWLTLGVWDSGLGG